jgi:hypothetical protein
MAIVHLCQISNAVSSIIAMSKRGFMEYNPVQSDEDAALIPSRLAFIILMHAGTEAAVS